MMYRSQYDCAKDYPIFVDPETGIHTAISERAYNQIRAMNERMHDFINKEGNKGKIQIHSTLADDTDGNNFKNIWEELK